MNLQEMAAKVMTLDWRLTGMPKREKDWAQREILKYLQDAYKQGFEEGRKQLVADMKEPANAT